MIRPALLAFACVLALSPGRARADGLMPLGRLGGGHSVGLEAVDAVKRTAQVARARSEKVGRKELEQVLVLPQRPGRNNVRYYDFDWRKYDFLDDQGVGGVRLYFYEREEEIARTAAALVREQYELLSRRFNYRPTTRVPYILYNSHREFENTNVFFVNEYVLGVTSPLDLRMALPFWGEIERFREVSTHEMVHQFTIQKVAERAAALGLDSPVMQLPLWFIEGIAEYYAKNGIDLETDLFARDMLLNSQPEKGYAVIGFWDDYPGAFIYTYKLGQLRVAFLAEHYGERIVQAILDQSPRLATTVRGGMSTSDSDERETFQVLVARLAREKPEAIAQRFSAWLKRRYLPTYLRTQQEPPAIIPIELEGEPDAFTAGADGLTMLYRSVERDTGRSRLYLSDRRDEESAVQVAIDGEPGLESLHPVLRGVTAVSADKVAFLARHGSADSLYIVPFTREVKGKKVELELGDRTRIELGNADLIEAGDPAFSPDGQRVAFFGLDGSGSIDIWVADLRTLKLERLTHDRHAERDLAWVDESPRNYGLFVQPGRGGDGTIIFATDATSHGRYNLAALDPQTGRQVRLTDEPADHRAPFALGGGQIVFSTDARGKPDLHLLDQPEHRITRLTDFVTGLTSPSPGPRGLMALGLYGGQYRIFDVPSDQLLTLDQRPSMPAEVQPMPLLPSEAIPGLAPEYEPYTKSNWRLENGVAAIGTAGAAIGQGALLFADVLSDRNLIVQLAMYGTPSLTDALAFFVDRSGRKVYGAGIFHTITQRRELDAPGFGNDVFFFQREFGLTGLWSYPFNTFSRVEARLTGQGLSREFQFPVDQNGFVTTAIETSALRTWDRERGNVDLEGLASLRYGYDTTRFRFPDGAIGGGSLLLELGGGYLPLRSLVNAYSTVDAQLHQRIFSFSVLHLRGAAGWATGGVFGRQYLISSYDNLRNYYVNDRRLLGSVYWVSNANLEFPLDSIIRLALVSNVEGVLGLDFGAVGGQVGDLWANRTLAAVYGVNFGLGPFEIRLHWARAFDIGGAVTGPGWVPNVSLRYAYF